jgi:hypothetical protein
MILKITAIAKPPGHSSIVELQTHEAQDTKVCTERGFCCKNICMRANVNLDNDAYTFAATYASAKGLPLGAAISELLRRAEHAPEPASVLLKESRLGLLVRAKREGERIVTPEMVKNLSEDGLA